LVCEDGGARLPFDLEAVSRTTLLSVHFRSIATVTSAELSEFLSRTANTWSMTQLHFRPLSLLRYRVIGRGNTTQMLASGLRVPKIRVANIGRDSALAELRALLSKKRRRTSKGPQSNGDGGADAVEIDVVPEDGMLDDKDSGEDEHDLDDAVSSAEDGQMDGDVSEKESEVDSLDSGALSADLDDVGALAFSNKNCVSGCPDCFNVHRLGVGGSLGILRMRVLWFTIVRRHLVIACVLMCRFRRRGSVFRGGSGCGASTGSSASFGLGWLCIHDCARDRKDNWQSARFQRQSCRAVL